MQIIHHKTGERIWHPLEHEGEQFYPEIEEYLATLPRKTIPVVVLPARKKKCSGEDSQDAVHSVPRPYSFSYAKRVVREARRNAGLPDHITMTACRHGGMTELGDAELSEQGIMALSAHSPPDAARGYVKKTDTQRLAATKKRRAWIEANREQTEGVSRNEPQNKSRNERK